VLASTPFKGPPQTNVVRSTARPDAKHGLADSKAFTTTLRPVVLFEDVERRV
jgi:hypothetical protein